MPFNKITSLHNPRIKKIILLREPGERKITGQTVVEGIREVTLACTGKVKICEIFCCPALLQGREAGPLLKKMEDSLIPIGELTKEVYSRISYGDRQEGLIAVCQPSRLSLDDLKTTSNPLYVVIEGVEKPGNLGAILRTCDAAGVDALFHCQGLTDLYNPNVIRASLGTVFTVPVIETTNEQAYDYFKKHRVTIYVTAPEAKMAHFQIIFAPSAGLVLGSEHEGISEFWRKRADTLLKIPMAGKVDSLNVSTSTGICLYEILRQRMSKSGKMHQGDDAVAGFFIP